MIKTLGRKTVKRTLIKFDRVVAGSESNKKKPMIEILGKKRLNTKKTTSIGVLEKIGVIVVF
jgi:hypothetical protein